MRTKGDEIKVGAKDVRQCHKCGRCWRHLPDVTADGELGERCSEVLNAMNRAYAVLDGAGRARADQLTKYWVTGPLGIDHIGDQLLIYVLLPVHLHRE